MKQARRRALIFAGAVVAAALCGGPRAGAHRLDSAFEAGPGPASWTDDLTPIGEADWSYARAAHLLERAGFGGSPEEIDRLAAMTPQQAVDYLVDYEAIDESALAPFIESGIWDAAMLPDVDQALEFGQGLAKARSEGAVYGVRPNAGGLRPYQPVINVLYYRNYATRHEWNRAVIWWGERMLLTPRPLEEKMTLFWHGHFATEQEKVRDYRLMLNQLKMLRAHATGNFRDLLIGIGQDPAMLIYLDNRKNIKGHANENFAREIMELFALGVGHYTEDDIKEAARAFTGWAQAGLAFVERPELHDDGPKTVLGETGNFKGEDIVDILLRQPACAEFITRKLYRFFVRVDISPEVNAALAETLRSSGYAFKPALKQMFLSRDFYSPAAYATQIKGPAQFLVSTYRKLGLRELPGTPQFAMAVERQGQALGNPPNVKGWDGGRVWINPSTFLERGNMMRHLLFAATAGGAYDLQPFGGRYQRYQFAPAECAQRDRQTLAGTAGAATYGGEGMMSGSETMMAAPSATMINETPEYDLPLGVYNGMNRAFERVLPIPLTPATLDLRSMLRAAQVGSAADAVDYLAKRFLRLPPAEEDRAALAAFAAERLGKGEINWESPETETALREVLHLILSAPEYQLA